MLALRLETKALQVLLCVLYQEAVSFDISIAAFYSEKPDR